MTFLLELGSDLKVIQARLRGGTDAAYKQKERIKLSPFQNLKFLFHKKDKEGVPLLVP